MNACPFEDQIDRYLLNQLSGEEKDRFEEHYFNCAGCFEKLAGRDELVRAVKRQGEKLVRDLAAGKEPARLSVFQRLLSFPALKPWAVAAVSAALVLVVIFGLIPLLRKEAPPRFFLNDEGTVRGESLSLVSPVTDVKTAPAYLEWKKLGEDVEYKISVYDNKLLWTETTLKTRIAVPDDIRSRMTAGQKYSWEVRAFSSKGILIAVSNRVHFRISAE